jgi:Holliday junction resolvase RusA-like endonuclease
VGNTVHDVSIEEGEWGMSEISFIIPGTPVGKGRPKFARRGNFVTAYTPEKTASYENLVKLAAAEAMKGRSVIDGAVSVWIGLYVTPPASWSQKKQRNALNGGIFPTSKPDLDNCIKGIFDACNEIVWKDDKQAVELTVMKKYSESARAVVQVTAI